MTCRLDCARPGVWPLSRSAADPRGLIGRGRSMGRSLEPYMARLADIIHRLVYVVEWCRPEASVSAQLIVTAKRTLLDGATRILHCGCVYIS